MNFHLFHKKPDMRENGQSPCRNGHRIVITQVTPTQGIENPRRRDNCAVYCTIR